MELELGTFEIELYCWLCNSNNCETTYNSEEGCIELKCVDCGNYDRIFFKGD